MPTMKIIDTCTMINFFDSLDIDLSLCFEGYYAIVTDHVVWEYTRKIPRHIPKCISVMGMSEEGKVLMEEMELHFPRLGIGERSVFVSALIAASAGFKVAVLSDDQDAIKKFSVLAGKPAISARFPGSENIIWGGRAVLHTEILGTP